MNEPIGQTYGSDKDGLVWGYRFDPGEPAADIATDAAAAFLADEHAPAGSFVWLHFSLSNVGTERWIARHLAPPPAFTESLRSEESSTRIEVDEGALVAVIHDVQFEFVWDPAHVATVCLCAEPRFLVTARLKPLRSVDRLRDTVRTGTRFRSSGDLFAQLLRQQADVMVEIVRNATRRVDDIEDKLLARNLTASRKELGALRGVLVRLQRLLAPEPAAMFRLVSRPPAWTTEEDLQDLRQAAEEFASAVTDSGALVDRLKQLQEELVAQINEQTGRTLFVLTIVTVLALPVNLIAGLFGMNVGGVPLAQSSHGFLTVVIALIALTALLAHLAFRGRR